MFNSKKGRRRRRRRRSELRLGTENIAYETTTFRPRLSLTPVLKFWQTRGAKLTGLFLLACLGYAAYVLFSSPTFFVYTAHIQGNVAVSRAEIYTASRVDSQSIFWVDPAEVVRRVTDLPNIKSAAVSVTLPANVAIEVVERRPELLWQSGQSIWWVDQEGMIVPPKEDLSGMLRIVDDDRQPVQAGSRIDPEIVRGGQTLRLLAPDVSVVRYSEERGLMVATPEGWPVYLGDGDQIKAKLLVLTALLADLKEQAVTPAYVDVRDPLQPVYQEQVVRVEPPPPLPNNRPFFPPSYFPPGVQFGPGRTQ